MNEKAYLFIIAVKILIAIGSVFIANFLLAYIRKNKGLIALPTMYLTVLITESLRDTTLFMLFFPYVEIVEFIFNTRPHLIEFACFSLVLMVFFAVDMWIRHSIQKKKMAKGDPGFLKYYDLTDPMEKENPSALMTSTEKT